MRVSRISFICLLFAAVAVTAVWAEQHQDAAPKIEWKHYENGQSAPLWVSAEMATDADGNINLHLLGEGARSRFTTVLLRVN
jgi:hypothetical protein